MNKISTPIYDFLEAYADSGIRRLHMPGHKGNGPLGIERYDITEVKGADSLYEADGIIAESELNATALFGSGRTLYSTEGSSQCIRAMLYLAFTHRCKRSGTIIAARNVHKAFLYAAALIGFDIKWLMPEGGVDSLCACPVSPASLERMLASLSEPPAAVYVTSPDYLGGMQDLAALAGICHSHGTLLLVDNAHGAYLHFCEPSLHPLDLGADMCCDSAHKTLPVLTGGAYLHISAALPEAFANSAKAALALFGSTSPSYLIMASLDKCNPYLASGFRRDVASLRAELDDICSKLRGRGWKFTHAEPLKLTIHASDCGVSGFDAAERLRTGGFECEYADADDVVLMMSPGNIPDALGTLPDALGAPGDAAVSRMPLPRAAGRQLMSVREAFFAPHETVRAADSLGRICAAPTVACPPAIPIAASGEEITSDSVALFEHYGIEYVEVVRQ